MASNDRRQRELSRQKAQRQAERREQAAARRRRRNQVIVGVLVAALVVTMLIGLVTALSGRDDTAASSDSSAPDDASPSDVQCDYIDNAPDPSTVTDVGRPPSDPGDLGELTATLTLNEAPVVISLDGSAAACTASSWEFLAAADYFDDTVCHRLTTSDTLGVLQCGDPSGTGRGGPGYRFAEENLEGATYTAGTVAMANTGQEATTGSQFFIVHSDSILPPEYTVVGEVVEGLDVVSEIAQAGTVDGGADGTPSSGADVSDLVVERSPS